MFTPIFSRRVGALCLALVVALSGVGRAADGDEKGTIDPQAKKVVDQFGKYYAGLKGFRVAASVSLTVEQKGQQQHNDFTQKFAAERPNKFSYAFESPQGGASVVSDGKELSLFIKGFQKYGVEKAPPTWSAMLENPLVMGAMSFGNAVAVMSAILSEDPAAKLLEKCKSLEYGGQVMLDETKCHLLKATTDEFDWQLWIDAGDKPVARQFVPDLSKLFDRATRGSKKKSPLSDVKVTNVVSYKDWELNPKFDDTAFSFKAPEGLAKVDSLMEIVGGQQQAEEGPHPLLGKAAPAVDLELLEGGKLDLASLKNEKVVILDFWATWCGPCVKAMPIIDKVAEKYKDKGVVLFAVNLKEEPDDVRKFLEEAEIKVDVALDKDGAVGSAYQASAIPQTVIIGKDGTVQVVRIGLSPNLEQQLSKDLDALVAGKDLAKETIAVAKDKAKADKEKKAEADKAKDKEKAKDDK